jgi:2-keto-3-deoxy-L-rhamnonate aldolase RhmA
VVLRLPCAAVKLDSKLPRSPGRKGIHLSLRTNTLKARLKSGEATLGSWVSVAHPTVAEVMGLAGYDWLLIDMEHGIIGIEMVQNLVQAIQLTPAAPLVRVPWNDAVAIKQVLETGPVGLLVPQVNTPAEAARAVQAASYPPRGIRGIGCQRPAGFGAWFDEYLRKANGELLIGVQIEHVRAVENIREILAVEGVDLVFVGANDLSASMGLLGQTQDPRVQEAISLVLSQANAAGVPSGLMAADPEEANRRIDEGVQFVGIGHDVGLLSTICRTHCEGVDRKRPLAMGAASRQEAGL